MLNKMGQLSVTLDKRTPLATFLPFSEEADKGKDGTYNKEAFVALVANAFLQVDEARNGFVAAVWAATEAGAATNKVKASAIKSKLSEQDKLDVGDDLREMLALGEGAGVAAKTKAVEGAGTVPVTFVEESFDAVRKLTDGKKDDDEFDQKAVKEVRLLLFPLGWLTCAVVAPVRWWPAPAEAPAEHITPPLLFLLPRSQISAGPGHAAADGGAAGQGAARALARGAVRQHRRQGGGRGRQGGLGRVRVLHVRA
jgi:hypothetical protein